MLAVLISVLACWTLYAGYMWFFEGKEIAFVLVWAVVAAVIGPGIILVHKQEFVPKGLTL
jgi:hypothetical protein